MKQKWSIGDLFLVPLSNGHKVVAQVIGQEKQALNSVICAFTRQRYEQGDVIFDQSHVIAALFTSRDLLDAGVWEVLENRKPLCLEDYFDIPKLKNKGFVGVRVIGSGIVIKFLEACEGLYPWDGYYDPEYFDKLLLHPDKKPQYLVYSKRK